jgi:excisionase family DNA binding protein
MRNPSTVPAAGHVPLATSDERISYTLQNAAAVVDLSTATLRRLERAGRLRFIRIGGRTLVCARSLHALATGQEPV